MSALTTAGAATTEVVESPPTGAVRSPSDVLRLAVVTGLLVLILLLQWLFGDTLTAFMADLLRGLSAVPDWLVVVIVVGTRILADVLLVIGLVVMVRRGTWRVLLTVAVAAGVAIAIAALLDPLGPDDGATVVDLDGDLAWLGSGTFPTAVGIAAASAALTAAAPWLSRHWRWAGWTLVMGLVLTRFLVEPISFDSVRAVVVGWVAGAAAVVLLGGPLRRPGGAAIATGLAAVGVPLSRLEQASLDARGSTPYFGVTTDGRRLFVKALGQDQRSADLLFRAYRGLKRRKLGDERPFSSLRRAVEHEALVALAARDLGLRTPRLVAFSTAEPNGFVLAYAAIEGRSLDRVAPEEVTDEVLAGIWAVVVEQRRHRIAHRDLRLANIFLADDGEVWMIDYGFSELAASDLLLATDVAELVASSSLQVGPERAVDHALVALGPAALATAGSRLHPWALGGATRAGLKARPGLLDDLRRRVTAAAP